MTESRQGAFDLPVETRFGHGDFLVSQSNRPAFELVERWPDWPSAALALYGPPGSGKTHLAHLWCARSGGVLIDAAGLNDPATLPLAVAVDDAERADERTLLHLYNMSRERGGSLLLTLPAPPAALVIGLADLASRLRSLPVAGIAPPDDALLIAVLLKHFGDRGIGVAPAVIAFLASRMERSFASAAALAAQLDRLSLESGRRVTIKMAREVLTSDG
ncbi:MAG TPA: DnaA regulatory inactivator Hda [Stellaceae bacterium]|nr:DnaA regulatory inactivator Hda [Stellaceae bacterium]